MTRTFDPYASQADDRYEAMAAARAGERVVATPAGWYVATAAGVTTGLREVEKFVGSFADTASLPEDLVPISAIPEPRHGRIRRVINSVVATHRMAALEPFAADLARRLVAAAVSEGAGGDAVDLVEAVVDPFPSAVIAEALGVPLEDHDRFRRWSDELLAAQQGAGAGRAMVDQHPEFSAYIRDAVVRRKQAADPPDDVIARLLRTDVDGEFLSDEAVCTQTMFLIIAGNETTRNLIANVLHTVATDPALYARLRHDRPLVNTVIEESLRHDSPVQVLGRAVLQDTVIDGRPLACGDRVVFGVASANRDEQVYECPEQFRLDRPRPREHLAFGAGPHVCPGASLARMEARLMVGAFLDAVGSFSLVDGFVPEPNPVFWAFGPRRLLVHMQPA
ncbi:MAG TPA: cytochrome P450 [Acidimicrobiales bacterium]|nr:cytochrome P450 [Acidimicrobiales bacterium]